MSQHFAISNISALSLRFGKILKQTHQSAQRQVVALTGNRVQRMRRIPDNDYAAANLLFGL
jgi:hypothetical protein